MTSPLSFRLIFARKFSSLATGSPRGFPLCRAFSRATRHVDHHPSRQEADEQYREGHHRQATGDHPVAGIVFLRGAHPAGGRAGCGQDGTGPVSFAECRLQFQAGSVYACPVADRHHRSLGLQSEDDRVRVPAGSGVFEYAAGRRDQPGHATDAVRLAGSHGRAARDRRWKHLRARSAVPGDRHAEPGGPRRNIPVARGTTGPLPDPVEPGLPQCRAGSSVAGQVTQWSPAGRAGASGFSRRSPELSAGDPCD